MTSAFVRNTPYVSQGQRFLRNFIWLYTFQTTEDGYRPTKTNFSYAYYRASHL